MTDLAQAKINLIHVAILAAEDINPDAYKPLTGYDIVLLNKLKSVAEQYKEAVKRSNEDNDHDPLYG